MHAWKRGLGDLSESVLLLLLCRRPAGEFGAGYAGWVAESHRD